MQIHKGRKARNPAKFCAVFVNCDFFQIVWLTKKADLLGSANSLWSSLRESNPYNQLGKLVFYH